MIRVKDGFRILFLGDSITDIKFNRRFSYKIHGSKVYALQVAKELNKKYKNLVFFYKGVASDRTYHVYDRLTKDCISLNPDIIIMLIGVNDAWENYVPEQYPPLLRTMQPHMKEIYRRLNCELDGVQLLVLLPFMIDSMPEKSLFIKYSMNIVKSLQIWRQKIMLKSLTCNKCSILHKLKFHLQNWLLMVFIQQI